MKSGAGMGIMSFTLRAQEAIGRGLLIVQMVHNAKVTISVCFCLGRQYSYVQQEVRHLDAVVLSSVP